MLMTTTITNIQNGKDSKRRKEEEKGFQEVELSHKPNYKPPLTVVLHF